MSGGNSNTTIAIPGAGWNMMWTNDFDDFQLDIVGFLAVLGEGSVLSIAPVSALSKLFYLPRLLPAPQALLRTERPTTLPVTTASVTAVHSGNTKEHVHHVASVLLQFNHNEMPPHAVRCVRITRDVGGGNDEKIKPHWTTIIARIGASIIGKAKETEPVVQTEPPMVKCKATGTLALVTMLGCFLSVSLFIISIVLGDGMSLLATLLLSGLSTLIGISNKCELKLQKRGVSKTKPGRQEVPNGDLVIRYPNGSFIVVICDEDVARELYFAPEELEYALQTETTYRLISLVGTLMLMLGVIFLANAKLQLQFCWGGAYVILNAAHWVAAALPKRFHWDLSRYKVEEHGIDGGPKNATFMDALAKAIMVTKSTRWVRNGGAAPQTEVWDQWLYAAEEASSKVGTRTEHVADRIWGKRGSNDKSTVWEVPNTEDWSARGAWEYLISTTDEPKGPGPLASEVAPNGLHRQGSR